ncbi:hydantoinase B/oxoprolinase family protein [Streptomyces brasiliensis]|uniref:Methylhydantoinase n=1 Tax=Streptomyces brasiliensis TaxID=1954 RepID=A0A917P403_9ACTN|nr:hydantoinase B/oxoprolinase family protein [Streptomyces brasiliensis]GGJ60486.1 methylhydantoinase [Streptomyces brasiliensis]
MDKHEFASEFFLSAPDVEKTYGLDLTTAETIRAGLIEASRHMRTTLMRGAFSNVVREVLDFGVSVHNVNPDGSTEMVAVTEGCTHFAFTHQHMVNMVLDEWGLENLGPGDTLVCNDPWRGSIHFPDINLIRPVFVDGELAFVLSDASHLTDIGGPVPGGFNSQATSMFEEGLRIPPTLITSGDVPVRSTINLILENVRTPMHALGDIRALFGTLRVGERHLRQLVDSYGVKRVKSGCAYTLDLAERRMRQAISAVPDGTYSAAVLLDDDGSNTAGQPLRMQASARVGGTHVEIDFSGTDSQARAATTTCWEETNRCLVGPKVTLDPRHPMNAGAMRPFHVVAPPGSLVMGLPPTSQSMHTEVGAKGASLMLKIFGQMLPDRAVAPDSGSTGSVVYNGTDQRHGHDSQPFGGVTCSGGSWGGTPTGDGISHNTSPIFSTSFTNVEYLERDTPMLLRGISASIDAAGAGKFRSGFPAFVAFESRSDDTVLSFLLDTGRFPSAGLRGGGPGMSTYLMELNIDDAGGFTQWNGLLPLDHVEAIAGCFGDGGQPTPGAGWGAGKAQTLKLSAHELHKGKIIVCYQAAGGGYGSPLDRDPELVRRDVWNELVSLDFALDGYGVVIEPGSLIVDEAATERLRAELRGAGESGWAPPPAHYRSWPRTTDDLAQLRARALRTGRTTVNS